LWRIIDQVESGQLIDRAEKISKNVMIWLCYTICNLNEIDHNDSPTSPKHCRHKKNK